MLNLGAGAERGTLRLQDEGVDVTALDVSPACVEACSRRRVRSTFVGAIQQFAETRPVPFDTIMALGNNLGLISSPEQAGDFFQAVETIGTEDVRLVGTMLDPYATNDPDHLAYHQRNRDDGRLGGIVRVRVRYRTTATSWFSLLWASQDELAELCARHGWTIAATHRSGIMYAAELQPV